jgi:hypothetical protein
MFVRFVTTELDDESHQELGIFHAARKLRDNGSLFAVRRRASSRNSRLVVEHHDVPVRMIPTSRPGYVVYEDEFQIVVVHRGLRLVILDRDEDSVRGPPLSTHEMKIERNPHFSQETRAMGHPQTIFCGGSSRAGVPAPRC